MYGLDDLVAFILAAVLTGFAAFGMVSVRMMPTEYTIESVKYLKYRDSVYVECKTVEIVTRNVVEIKEK